MTRGNLDLLESLEAPASSLPFPADPPDHPPHLTRDAGDDGYGEDDGEPHGDKDDAGPGDKMLLRRHPGRHYHYILRSHYLTSSPRPRPGSNQISVIAIITMTLLATSHPPHFRH